MQKITLTHSTNLARHWSLVALAETLGCDPAKTFTCPIKIHIHPISQSSVLHGERAIVFSGTCDGQQFLATCQLSRNEIRSPHGSADPVQVEWNIEYITINVQGAIRSFFREILPEFDTKKIFVG